MQVLLVCRSAENPTTTQTSECTCRLLARSLPLTWVWRHAGTGVKGNLVHFKFGVDGVVVCQFDHLLESIIDEDEADEGREALFREPGEILDQEAGVSGNQDKTQEGGPQTDPEAELQIMQVIVSANREITQVKTRDKGAT